jgi:hypothetical protein
VITRQASFRTASTVVEACCGSIVAGACRARKLPRPRHRHEAVRLCHDIRELSRRRSEIERRECFIDRRRQLVAARVERRRLSGPLAGRDSNHAVATDERDRPVDEVAEPVGELVRAAGD